MSLGIRAEGKWEFRSSTARNSSVYIQYTKLHSFSWAQNQHNSEEWLLYAKDQKVERKKMRTTIPTGPKLDLEKQKQRWLGSWVNEITGLHSLAVGELTRRLLYTKKNLPALECRENFYCFVFSISSSEEDRWQHDWENGKKGKMSEEGARVKNAGSG